MALEQHHDISSHRFIVAIVCALIDELVGDRFDGCFVYLKVQSFLDTLGTDTIPEVTGEKRFSAQYSSTQVHQLGSGDLVNG